MVPLNLATGVEPNAEIVVKVVGQGAIYLRCVVGANEDASSEDDALLKSVFEYEERYVYLKILGNPGIDKVGN